MQHYWFDSREIRDTNTDGAHDSLLLFEGRVERTCTGLEPTFRRSSILAALFRAYKSHMLLRHMDMVDGLYLPLLALVLGDQPPPLLPPLPCDLLHAPGHVM